MISRRSSGMKNAGAWPYALPYAGLDPTVAAMAASAAGLVRVFPMEIWGNAPTCATWGFE